MSDGPEIKFYSTLPHPCSYLDDTTAVTHFMDPEHPLNQSDATLLSELGFRRSGTHVYRPHCPSCRACISIRIPVEKFLAKKSFRRVIKRNSDVQISEINSIDTDECFQLYSQYINLRHADGDMYPATLEQYQQFLVERLPFTQYIAYRLEGKLIAVSVMDQLKDGFSSVYTFFDPTLPQRSLGRFAILWQINHCIEREVPHLYLGYWIKQCDKMNYKTEFRPLEMFVNNRWIGLQ